MKYRIAILYIIPIARKASKLLLVSLGSKMDNGISGSKESPKAIWGVVRFRKRKSGLFGKGFLESGLAATQKKQFPIRKLSHDLLAEKSRCAGYDDTQDTTPLMILAGFPATTTFSGTSLVTIAPAPMTEFFLICRTDGMIIARAPIQTPSST